MVARRALTGLLATAACFGATAAQAAADPANNKNTLVLTLTCDNGFSGAVTTIGTAGLAAGSTTVGTLKGVDSPLGSYRVAGFEDKDLVACTALEQPGFTYLVKFSGPRA